MKPIAPNTLIQNRYLIVHLIGKGGMGEVYLAVDQRLGSAIALKRTFFSDDATLGQAFEREARTLARLRHPVLPKVSDHFTEEGTQYLVMEHISGDDISKRLETSQKPFPVSWVLFWADQLLDALNYLHSHEPPIVHRDIKPQNLKLTDENHIVLLDFGLSKNSVGETRVTTAGSIVGYTPHYAPMEQIRGTGTDARSDIYSLAATLYQILTNTVPPDALTRADSLINGMPDPVTPINELNPEVSRAVSSVIIKGMAISQEQRYKTAREMQKALRDAYAQLQTDMSANTVAFTTPTQAEVPQSQQKTVQISSVPHISQAPAQSQQTQPTAFDSGTTGANTHSAQTPNANKIEPNFDATIRYDSKVPEPAPKQSDIKTEVFLAGSIPEITAAQNESYARKDNFPQTDSYGKDDNLTQGENFAMEGNVGQAENYSPNATVPLFSFDKNDGAGVSETAVGFDSIPRADDNKTSAGATFVPAENYAPGGETRAQAPIATPQPKKSGKGLAIAGGLFALLVLAIGAAGIGWYMFRDKGTTTEITTPTPTVATTASAVPTVAPTLEVVTDTNSAINSQITTTNTNSTTNSTVTTRPTQTTVQTTGQPMPPVRVATPRATPQTVTLKTPTATESKTPPPAKTPKRTDIEQ
jgi:serine/threonine protein kinase